MDSKKAKARIEELAAEIDKQNYKYYVLDDPAVSDLYYDKLLKELEALEEKYPKFKKPESPTGRVGGEPLDEFEKGKHVVPMLSLSNALAESEFLDFDQRVHKILEKTQDQPIEYFTELKFDGLSMSLTYTDGVLVRACTRGDGETGEVVTQNIKTIRSIPLKLKCNPLPKQIEIRCEVVMPLHAFQKLNVEQEKNGDKIFSNPRNAAAGTIRQLDPSVVAKRRLDAYVYGFGMVDGISFLTLIEFKVWAKEAGFKTDKETALCKGTKDVLKFYKKIEEKRASLPFEIDGIVVKLNKVRDLDQAGFIARSPRGMIAFKYPPRVETTVIEDIIIQVGRTGVLTPVAEVKPVFVGGAMIRRATLHNQDEIDRKDIRIGDTVFIQRAGDVIPEVVKVIIENRNGKEKKYRIPDKCPVCGSSAVRKEGEASIRCTGKNCPAKLIESLKHFVKKDALNIEGLGEKIIEQLVEEKKISEFSDIYQLKEKDLVPLEGFKEKSIQNLLDAIKISKKPETYRIIYGLGIRHIGESSAKLLAKNFRTVEKLMDANQEELVAIHEIGEEMAKSVVEYFSDDVKRREVTELLKILEPVLPQKPVEHQNLNGKTFVITGTFSKMARTDVEKMIEGLGGRVSSSVSKKTDYVVRGENPGSKVEKAQALGVKIISEEEFLQLTS